MVGGHAPGGGDDDDDREDDSRPALAGFVTARGGEVLHGKVDDDAESMHDYIIVDSLADLYGVDATAMGMRKDDDDAAATTTTTTSSGSADVNGVVIRRGGGIVVLAEGSMQEYSVVPGGSTARAITATGLYNGASGRFILRPGPRRHIARGKGTWRERSFLCPSVRRTTRRENNKLRFVSATTKMIAT